MNAGLTKLGLYTDQLYQLTKHDNDVRSQASEKKSLPIVIIGKEHCFECSKDLPIAKLEEAIDAAKHIDSVAPFDGKTFFYAEPLANNQTRVYFFTIKQTVYRKFSSSALLLVPESLLLLRYLTKNKENNNIKVQRCGSEVVACLQQDGFICTNDHSQSHHVIQHIMTTAEQGDLVIEPHYLPILYKQLLSLPRYVYWQIINFDSIKAKLTKVPSKAIGVALISIVCLYLMSTSAWLYYKNQSLTHELTQQRSALNEVFALQSALEHEKTLLSELANNEKLTIVTAPVWKVILPLLNDNTEILSVSYFDHLFTLRVKSPRATDVIQFLSDNPLITTPEVTSSVVKSRGKEIITVRFSLLNRNTEQELAKKDNNEST